MRRYTVGIDPGFGETGVVLYDVDDDGHPIAWSTFSCGPGETDICRTVSLGGVVVNLLLDWIKEYGIKHLDVAIELPIYNKNPKTFTKQIRLLEELESGIFHIIAGQVEECWMTEVNPKTSKMLATTDGDAPKAAMVAASPFKEYNDVLQPTREALADAWAHGLATWGGCNKCVRVKFSDLRAAEVRYVYAGRKIRDNESG